MILSLANGYLYIANQKVASESTHLFAGDDSEIGLSRIAHQKHILLDDFIELSRQHGLDIPFSEVTILGVIREPAAWYVSWYNSRSRVALANPNHRAHGNYTGRYSFDAYLEAASSQSPPQCTKVRPQRLFLEVESPSPSILPIAFDRFSDSVRMLFGNSNCSMGRLDLSQSGTRKNRSRNVRIKRSDLSSDQVTLINTRLFPEDYHIYRTALDNVSKLTTVTPSKACLAASKIVDDRVKSDKALSFFATETSFAHALTMLYRNEPVKDVVAHCSQYRHIDIEMVLEHAINKCRAFKREQ